MLMKVYNQSHVFVGHITKCQDLQIDSDVSTGDKTMAFTLLEGAELKNEYYIRTKTDEYVVKEISQDSGGFPAIIAVLNLEDLQAKSWETFQISQQRLADAARLAVEDTGWTIGECDIFKIRNAGMPKCTSLTVIENLCTAFMAEPIYDTISKTISFKAKRGSDKGAYFINGLNLKSLSKKSDSNGFFTRIIPIGKDGMTINDVNDGKNYIDNHQYSDKVIQYIWEDENYTDPGALKEDAEAYLKDKSKPYLSYSADIVDLAAQKPEYGILSYELGDTVRIIDQSTGTQEEQRIVKMTEYPDEPERNTCELANAYLTFEEWQERLQAAASLVENALTSDGKIYVSDILEWEKGVAESQSVKDLQEKQKELQDNVDNFVSEVYDPAIADMQRQLDGQIETWYYDYDPSDSTAPTNAWTDMATKAKHVGDMFFNKTNGTTYRYTMEGDTYSWKQVRDEDINNALAAASDAQDTADEKRRVFVDTPKPPYEPGDLWAQGKTGDLLRCLTGRSAGETYHDGDFIPASKYTDDAALNAFIAKDFATLKAQADKKAETWYQESDPSTAWTDPAVKAEHKGDIWYDMKNQVTKQWNGTAWQEMKTTPPANVFDRIDGKAQIFVETPKPPYDVGDLWFMDANSPIRVCNTKKIAGQTYAEADWIKKDNYVDSTVTDPIDDKATSAGNKADAADKKADSAQQDADNANGTLDDWGYNGGRDYIDGANIAANTIKANQIDVNDLFAQNITATGTITGATLKGGRIESAYGTRKIVIENSCIAFFKNSKETGEIAPIAWGNNYTYDEGVMFGTKSDYLALAYLGEGGGWAGGYILNRKLNPDGYKERNILYGTTRVTGAVALGDTVALGDEKIKIQRGTLGNEPAVCIWNGTNSDSCVYITPTGAIVANDYVYVKNYFQEGGSKLSNKYAAISHTHTASQCGAAASNHTHSNYLPLAGGTMTGDLTVSNHSITLSFGKSIGWTASSAYISSPQNQQLVFSASQETNYRLFYGVSESMWTLSPEVSDKIKLGTPGRKWGQIYSSSSTIQTSDRTQKHDISAIPAKYEELFAALKPVTYMFNGGDRTHTGFISQDIEESLAACGMTPLDFAAYCRDPGENGGYVYGLRYEEIIALNTHMIQKLMRRVEELEGELAAKGE